MQTHLRVERAWLLVPGNRFILDGSYFTMESRPMLTATTWEPCLWEVLCLTDPVAPCAEERWGRKLAALCSSLLSRPIWNLYIFLLWDWFREVYLAYRFRKNTEKLSVIYAFQKDLWPSKSWSLMEHYIKKNYIKLRRKLDIIDQSGCFCTFFKYPIENLFIFLELEVKLLIWDYFPTINTGLSNLLNHPPDSTVYFYFYCK